MRKWEFNDLEEQIAGMEKKENDVKTKDYPTRALALGKRLT